MATTYDELESTTATTESAVVAELAERATEPMRIDGEETRPELLATVLSNDRQLLLRSLEEFEDAPRRVTGAVQVDDHESLIGYVNRHKTMLSTLWSQPRAGRMVAVLNDQGADAPAWADHRATMQLRATPEWDEWYGHDGKLRGQQEFAEWLEQWAHTVASPDAAELLEVATDLRAKRDVNFRQAVRLQSGAEQFTYEESVTTSAGRKGTLTVPEKFEVAVSPFEGVEPGRITARLRFRITAGGLALGYHLDNPTKFVRDVFATVSEAVVIGTDLPLFAGVPQSIR